MAIVVTLLYLTIETRQNTNALIASSRQAMLDSDMDWLADGLEFPGLADRGDAADLSAADAARLEIMWVRYLRIREFSWFQYRSGILDERTWESFMRPTASVFASQRARRLLEPGGYNGDPEFIEYLRQWLEDHAIEP